MLHFLKQEEKTHFCPLSRVQQSKNLTVTKPRPCECHGFSFVSTALCSVGAHVCAGVGVGVFDFKAVTVEDEKEETRGGQ